MKKMGLQKISFTIKNRIQIGKIDFDALYIISLILTFFHAWYLTFYANLPYMLRIGWVAADGDPKWPLDYNVGTHTFSDFTLVHIASLSSNPWTNSPIPYPPFPVFLIRIFSIFPFKLALFLWLVALSWSLLYPIIDSTRDLNLRSRIAAITIYGLVTAPFIATIDRGNSIGLIVLPLYLTYKFIVTERKFKSGFCLGLAAALKIYPFFLIPILLMKKQIKVSVISLITFLILNTTALFFWGFSSQTIKPMISNLRNFGSTVYHENPMFMSFSTILSNAIHSLGLESTKFFSYSEAHPLRISLFLYIIILFSIRNTTFMESYFLGLICMQLIPLVSFSYTRVWALIAVGILLSDNLLKRDYPHKTISRVKSVRAFWWLICFLVTTPLTILSFFGNSLLVLIAVLLLILRLIYLNSPTTKIPIT